MTYPSDEESATPLPSWLKLMRWLVFALLCVSILAMVAVGWAAVRLVGEATKVTSLPENVSIPNGATPLSTTALADGRVLVIFVQDGVHKGELRAADGSLLQEVAFQ